MATFTDTPPPTPGRLLQPPGLGLACSYHTEYPLCLLLLCSEWLPNLTTEESGLSLRRLRAGYQDERGGCGFYLCGCSLMNAGSRVCTCMCGSKSDTGCLPYSLRQCFLTGATACCSGSPPCPRDLSLEYRIISQSPCLPGIYTYAGSGKLAP